MFDKISTSDSELTQCTLEDYLLIVSDIEGALYQIDIMRQQRYEVLPKCQSQVIVMRVDIKNYTLVVCEEHLFRIRVVRLVQDFGPGFL